MVGDVGGMSVGVLPAFVGAAVVLVGVDFHPSEEGMTGLFVVIFAAVDEDGFGCYWHLNVFCNAREDVLRHSSGNADWIPGTAKRCSRAF